MAILNPDHLFEQAEKLIAPQPAGRPRQVDVRRAISSACYGLFHFMMTEVADEFIGVTQRTSDRYALVYRSINHNVLKELCNAAKKRTPPPKYVPYFPAGGFDQNIQASAAALVDLQEKWHIADYNPRPRVSTSEAKLAIGTARSAVQSFQRANLEGRQAFLTLK
jgi:hypothetical protein